LKLLSKGRAIWLDRRSRIANHKHLRAAGMRRHCDISRSGASSQLSTVVLALPSALLAETVESRDLVLDVLHTTLRHVSRGDRRVKLDFSRVQKIFPGGMLMLLAHLELLCRYFPGRIRVCCHRGSMAAQLIRHFGFGTRLGVPADGNAPMHHSVVCWRFATGHQADGERLHQHIREFSGMITSDVPQGLYNALTEATTNVQHHAYPIGTDIPADVQRWWLFSRVEDAQPDRDGVLYLAFYDVGVGIPESMKKALRGLREKGTAALQALLATLNISDGHGQDADLLRLAVEHPRTSTGLPFRGKGLPEMKDFAAATPGGRLTIISGFGQYVFRADSQSASAVKCHRGILGTLILWNLPLSWKEPTA
jgi:hypothetical protein